MVELKEITKNNLDNVLKLKVAKNQEDFVSSNVHSLAQAWVYRKTAFPFAIYADNVMVGFIMLGYYESKNQYTIWKLMIDKQYQNRGFAKKALNLAINYLVNNFTVKTIVLGVAFENTTARNLYRSFGFKETGESDEFQFEMGLVIDT
ncbi:N-acetyltransferase [Vallitalea longa]|uniref:N-acetyltransferase n=1 Tax=Vallitalea longa TaxID=2936439 RepID=A0A9W5Y8Z9_9FIRM|nr:GNAT family N-acetyltransferase [Vallitalea longa]GKX28076.1 N-acetyltransferase [Vallitalea longa]